MSHFVIDFKLGSGKINFLKNIFPTNLVEILWQSMASVAMFKYELKSKDLLWVMKKIYDTIYGNPCWSDTKTLAMNKLKRRRDVYLNGGNRVGNCGIRKKRDTSYSMTQRLMKTLGNEVEQTWQQYGMYKAANILSYKLNEYVSPYILRYMSNKYNWKRKCNPKSAIYKGVVITRRVSASYYKHLIFPGGKE